MIVRFASVALAMLCAAAQAAEQPTAEPAIPSVPEAFDLSLVERTAMGTPVTRIEFVIEPSETPIHRIQLVEPAPRPAPAAERIAAPSSTSTDSPSGLLRPISSLTLGGGADPELVEQLSRLPAEFAIVDLSTEQFGSWDAPVGDAAHAPARFAATGFHWTAPAFYSRPLYFEQPNLERYGHHVAICDRDNLTQSAISAAHFFATIPILPCKIGSQRPDECSYVLGAYRPGSCNPHQLLWPECTTQGITLEAAVATGMVFLIP